MPTCGTCGRDNAPGARFCNDCGAALTAPVAEVRKTVTVLFCDLVGSTALGERTDPEVLREIMGRYHAQLRRILEVHGGTVEKFVGDAVMAVFGIPHVHEDDALRAVRAAVAMRDAVGELGLRVRIGVNTGEVVTGTGETLVTGDAVNVAARLEQSAATDEVLIGAVTRHLVGDAARVEPIEPLVVKGKSEPVPAWRVTAVDVVPAPRQSSSTLLVGRDDELRVLRQAVEEAQRTRTPQLVTVVGPPGIGKTRLVAELVGRHDGDVLVGRCLSYGDAITYWPLVEIVRALGTVDAIDGLGDDAALVSVRLTAAVGASGAAASPDEIAWAVRRLLEALGRDRTVLVVFDDIHWAEPTLLDLIEYVAAFAQGTRLLLLCTARPELFEQRADWATPRPNATVVRLEPLDAACAQELVDRLGDVPAAVRDRVIDAADGNPLFVEQLVAMHLDTGDPVVDVPPNLQALLAARIDRLEAEERLLIERASIEGRQFHRGAVLELLPESSRRDIGTRLMTLVRRELIRPDRATLRGDDGFRFGHVLIRDAAYDSMPKRVRADLHERYAAWLLQRLDTEAPPEIVGYHLEQAHRLTEEIGGSTPGLGARAAEHLARAGAAARLRQDAPAAAKLYERAAAVADDATVRAQLLLYASEVRRTCGDLAAASAAHEEAASLADRGGDRRLRHLVAINDVRLRFSRDPEGVAEAAIAAADSAIADAADDDHHLLARAWQLMASAHEVRAEMARETQALDKALFHARQAGDRAVEIQLSIGWGGAIVYGPMPVDEGERKIADVLARVGDVPTVQAFALHVISHLRARRGDFDEALESLQVWRTHIRELGHHLEYAMTASCVWDVCALSGDYARGEQALVEGDALLVEAGDRLMRPTLASLRGHALYAQGRLEEAERLALLSRELGSAEDVSNEALWRSLLAKLRARAGEHEDAVALAREAVVLADRTDMLDARGDAYLDLAEVLAAGGDEAGARAAAAEAATLYRRKGNRVGTARAEAAAAVR